MTAIFPGWLLRLVTNFKDHSTARVASRHLLLRLSLPKVGMFEPLAILITHGPDRRHMPV
jgi:hypothetical protein